MPIAVCFIGAALFFAGAYYLCQIIKRQYGNRVAWTVHFWGLNVLGAVLLAIASLALASGLFLLSIWLR